MLFSLWIRFPHGRWTLYVSGKTVNSLEQRENGIRRGEKVATVILPVGSRPSVAVGR